MMEPNSLVPGASKKLSKFVRLPYAGPFLGQYVYLPRELILIFETHESLSGCTKLLLANGGEYDIRGTVDEVHELIYPGEVA